MVNKLLRDAEKKLTNSNTPLLDARVLLSSAAKCENASLLFRDLTEDEIALFNKYIQMRSEGMPVSYITGEKEFMGYPFYVDSSTLIPRPDTECLVEKVLEISPFPSPRIIDLCTGSGCIGISLALFLKNSTVDLTDISCDALEIAKKNIARHNLDDRVNVFRLDVLSDEIKNSYDIITANPPYIPSSVVPTLEVSAFEPTSALDGGNDGLDFYRIIVGKAYQALNKGGILALEIGYDQGKSVPLLMHNFTSVSLYKDYGDNDRVVVGIK